MNRWGLGFPRPAASAGPSEEWSLRRHTVASWEALWTERSLTEFLVLERLPDLTNRLQAEVGQGLGWPPGETLILVGVGRRLGDDQPAAYLEKGSGALGDDGRASE